VLLCQSNQTGETSMPVMGCQGDNE
jgi:hypothetical protein